MKRISYPEQLTLDKAVYSGRQGRQYRLVAVVEHIGDQGTLPYAPLTLP